MSMEMKPGMIADPEQARIAANAEKPIRDLAREEGVTEEEKNILDKLAERRGEKVLGEHLSKKEIATQPAEKMNEFGLPENWSHDLALQALEYIKDRLKENPNPTQAAFSKWLEKIYVIGNQEYKKFKPNGNFHVMQSGIIDIEGANGDKLFTLRKSPEEKLKIVQGLYPRGFEIQRTNKYIKWEKILDYEMWAIKNHGQTLAAMNRRHGARAAEIISIISGVDDSEWYKGAHTHEAITKFEEEKLMPWLQQKGFLAD